MNSLRTRVLLTLAAALGLTLNAADSRSAEQSLKLPAKEKCHLYLMMGQSNMSGRGKVEADDRTPHPRVLMFTTNAVWQPAVESVTQDRPRFWAWGRVLCSAK